MASEEITATVYTCDDPACPTRIIAETDELPDGFHGDVTEAGGFGGRGGKWFACRASHIQDAVVGAIARSAEQG